MAEINNYLNPKGYALCIGLNHSIFGKELFHCLSDVDYWSQFFSSTCGYSVVRTLKQREANKENVYMALWCLAAHSMPGDIVAITISSHGDFTSENFISLSDGKMSEAVFRLFLRAFKPGVRVVVITDTCQSGTFVDYNPPKDISENSKDHLISFFANKLPHARNELSRLINTSKETPLSAHIAHFASSSDDANVPDGLLVTCTKNYLSWGLQWYELGEYREAVQELFREIMYTPLESANTLVMYSIQSNDVKQVLVAEAKKMGYSDIFTFLLMNFRSLQNTVSVVNKLKKVNFEVLNAQNENLYEKDLDRIVNNAKYKFTQIPILSFHGKKSLAFQHQYAFAKNSPAFKAENA